jgi:hypothetical protein
MLVLKGAAARLWLAAAGCRGACPRRVAFFDEYDSLGGKVTATALAALDIPFVLLNLPVVLCEDRAACRTKCGAVRIELQDDLRAVRSELHTLKRVEVHGDGKCSSGNPPMHIKKKKKKKKKKKNCFSVRLLEGPAGA